MSKVVLPLGDRVLVKPDEALDKTRGGIIIPDVAKEIPAEGVVVAVGPGIRKKEGGRFPMPDVKPGDRVIFSKYGGVETKINGVAHKIMREDDVIGIVTSETDAPQRIKQLEQAAAAS